MTNFSFVVPSESGENDIQIRESTQDVEMTDDVQPTGDMLPTVPQSPRISEVSATTPCILFGCWPSDVSKNENSGLGKTGDPWQYPVLVLPGKLDFLEWNCSW